MDFDLTDVQTMTLDGWEKCITKEIVPLIDQKIDEPFSKNLAHKLIELMMPCGVGSGWVPENLNGLGVDFLTSGLMFEKLSQASPDVAGLAWVAEGAALKIANNGSENIRNQYLPRIINGEIFGCSAISEPGIGSSVREMRTTAKKDGKYFRISGEKMWVSNASVADFMIVLALTAEQEFSMFLVDKEQHGYEVREIGKLGLNRWSMGQVLFDNIVVPEENLLGSIGSGLRETMKGFDRSRCFVSTLALGIARTALDESIQYSKERTQFGKPIAGHQLIQGLLAEMATDFSAAQLLVYKALAIMSQGKRCELEAAIAKSFTTEDALRITSKAIQIHGAFGLTKEFPLERHFRNARMLTIPDGTTQINQLIIGRKLTGIDAFS